MPKEIAVIHALKNFKEGNPHLDGTMGVFNADQKFVLDDALKFHTKMNGNYTVVAVVLLSYAHENANVWCDSPTGEICRWSLV